MGSMPEPPRFTAEGTLVQPDPYVPPPTYFATWMEVSRRAQSWGREHSIPIEEYLRTQGGKDCFLPLDRGTLLRIASAQEEAVEFLRSTDHTIARLCVQVQSLVGVLTAALESALAISYEHQQQRLREAEAHFELLWQDLVQKHGPGDKTIEQAMRNQFFKEYPVKSFVCGFTVRTDGRIEKNDGDLNELTKLSPLPGNSKIAKACREWLKQQPPADNHHALP
jgi:hypothetical protein